MTLEELEAAFTALVAEVAQLKNEVQRHRRIISRLRDEFQAKSPRINDKIDWEQV